MILEFSVGNFRSFKERTTLSLLAAKLKAKDCRLDQENTFQAPDGTSLLRSAAIYGANAGGKSNLIRAIAFMKQFVLNSSKETQAGERIGVEPFLLSTAPAARASHFEMVFFADKVKYRYGFEVNAEHVTAEWLYHVPSRRESVLFERNETGITQSGVFREGRGIETKTRTNALFLSVVAQFNGPMSQAILGWFRRLAIIADIENALLRQKTISSFENKKTWTDVVRLLKKLDLGIINIQITKKPLGLDHLPAYMPEDLKDALVKYAPAEIPVISTGHRVYDEDGQAKGERALLLDTHESDGTQRLFALSAHLVDALRNGSVLVVDELDARLHPVIVKAIVGLVDSSHSNGSNAQLVFTTHDTSILSNQVFRRDQVWFAEKNRQESTNLYSLAEYRIRNDASFGPDYIRGKYGAIPFVRNMDGSLGA